MGFRFRSSINILPGVRLNVSKSGMSTSIGTRGATVNIGKRGVRGTVGIPGTGISYSERLDSSSPQQAGQPKHQNADADSKNLVVGIAFIAALVLVAYVISRF